MKPRAPSRAFRPNISLLLLSWAGAPGGGVWLGRAGFADEEARLGRGSRASSRSAGGGHLHRRSGTATGAELLVTRARRERCRSLCFSL